MECICASDQARNRLLSVLVSSLHGDPAEVLEGLLAGQSAPGAAEGEEAEPAEEEAGPQRAKRAGGGKKADPAPAAARAGGKKKSKKGKRGGLTGWKGRAAGRLARHRCAPHEGMSTPLHVQG